MKSVKRTAIFLCMIIFSGVFHTPGFSQKSHRKYRKVQQYIDDGTNNKLSGVVVCINSKKHGKWIGTSGYSNLENKIPLKKDNIFSLASIGKMYNAIAVLKLVEEGKLGLDDKIEQYLPKEIIEAIVNAEQVTIRQLLNHTSGFCNYNAHPELNELYLSNNLKLDTFSHMDALRKYAYGKHSSTKPLGTYSYSSTNYLLLTMIIDSILPAGHENYLKENILAKNGFTHTFYKQTPPIYLVEYYGDLNEDGALENLCVQTIETTNWYSGDDGIYAPIEEACDLLERLMYGEILNQETLKEMTTWNDEKYPDYGLGLMASKGFPYKLSIGHSGRGIGTTTDLYYFPEQEITIAIFCNTGLRSGSKELSDEYYKMRRRIIRKMFLI